MKKIFALLGTIASLAMVFVLSPVGPWGCGSSSTRAADSGGTSTTTTAENQLALAYPDDLAVGSITAASSGVAALSRLILSPKAVDVTVQNPSDQKEDIATLLKPPDQATFQEKMGDLKNQVDFTATVKKINCYGPALNYTNHPDFGAQGAIPMPGGTASGQLPGGDLGIWLVTETATGQACIAAQFDYIMGQIQTTVDMGTKTVAMVFGANALDAGESSDATAATDLLPVDKGGSKDLKDAANSSLDQAGVPIDLTEATITRESSDNSEGFPVYMTETTGTITAGADSLPFEMVLEHVPEIDPDSLSALKNEDAGTLEDSTYSGVLTQKISLPTNMPNCQGVQGITRCMRLEYDKSAETSLTYFLKTAEFCGQGVACENVDPADKYSATNKDGWGGNFYRTICTVNPEDGSGSCSSCWQAGAMDGNTRCLLVRVASDGSGCGYFGYGPDMATTSGAIDRMICNWAGPGNNHTGVAKAQRQCFSKDSTGKLVSDSSKLAITFAPTNACNKTAAQNAFAYGLQSPPTDVTGATVVTNNLVDLPAIDVTVPTPPTVNIP